MNSHILHITCLTDNFPDGQKITGARLQYDRPIDGRWITPAAFQVKDRSITGIGVEGDTVTLRLDAREAKAYIIPPPGPRPGGPGPGRPGGPGGPRRSRKTRRSGRPQAGYPSRRVCPAKLP